ncbi:hypothetical protein R9X47_27725 [Wukongibacter baidiensis]|uniref:hypothetical protein n=1 Tax=Wukongibacter baidiensis TaxID=1723361 RepID=UPI003D7F2E17
MERGKVYFTERKEKFKSISINLSIVFGSLMFIVGAHFNDLDLNDLNLALIIPSIVYLFIMTMIFFTTSPTLRVTKIVLNEEKIMIKPFLDSESYEIKWSEIELVLLGDMQLKNDRFGRVVYGFEFRGYRTSDVVKISHIEYKEQLISDVINYCEMKNIDFKDLSER